MIKMKDSGIPWIGQIPEDWEVCKIKFLCSEIFSGGTPSTNNDKYWNGDIPWLQSGKIQNDYIFEYDKTITKEGLENSSTKMVMKDSILLAMTGATCSNVGYLTFNSCANQSVMAYIPLKNTNPKFLFYILIACKNEILLHKNGGAQSGINGEVCQNLYAPKLPLKIQQKIVEILDKKCGQIDELVRIEENEIEKLKEYKTSLITKVVTKGLDHNAKMKDSGIPWIGQIPESWITIKIKFTSWLKGRIGWDGLKSSEFKEDGPFLITGTDFNNGNIKWDTCAHITEERFMEDELLHVKEGDLLITKDGTIGKLAIVKNCPEKVSLNSGVMIIRNNSNWTYDNKYLYYILLSNQFYLWYEKSQNGNSTIKHLYQEQFYNFEFSYPNILYQKRIVAYLDNKCEEIDNLIKIKQEKIEKLKEYKKSLIYQYVTGKKEVV